MVRRNRIGGAAPEKYVGRRRVLEWSKSALIALLTLSAVYLAGCCLSYSGAVGGAQGNWVANLVRSFHPATGVAVSGHVTGRPMDAAVCIALSTGTRDGQGAVTRYAVQYDAESTKKLSDAVSFHLSSALASAKAPDPVTETQWRAALEGPGIYFELLGSVPLRALNIWQRDSAVNPALPEKAEVRRLLLAYRGGKNVSLYYINETDGMYYACETAVAYEGTGGLQEEIVDEMSKTGPNRAAFAFELQENQAYSALDPYVMITDPLPARVYRSSNPMSLQDEARRAALQQALSFPNHYSVNGEVVIWEGNEKLRIDSIGAATYKAAGQNEPRYPVDASGTAANAPEMIEAARRVADLTVGAWCGAAQIYLEGIHQIEDGSWEVSFGYSLNGSAVMLPNGVHAAVFSIRNGRIDAFTLRFRTYEDTGETEPVLPISQAVAAMSALQPEGGTLALCYQDGGDGSVRAGWAAR